MLFLTECRIDAVSVRMERKDVMVRELDASFRRLFKLLLRARCQELRARSP